MIELCARIVFKEIMSDDDSLGYDDARTREIQEIISDDDTVGFSFPLWHSLGGWAVGGGYQPSMYGRLAGGYLQFF